MFSFLFSGGSKEDEQRLNNLEASLESCSSDAGARKLEQVAACARELREVMDNEVSRGAKSHRLLQRIEALSTVILDNLESRLTSEFFREHGCKAAVQKMLLICKDLDAVRATRASTIIEARVAELEEQFAQEELQKVAAAMEQLKEVQLTGMVRVMQDVVGVIEKAHGRAPRSRQLADALLKKCVAIANMFLSNLPKVMRVDSRAAADGRAFAERLDAVGTRMVNVMQSTWDPPVLPKVDELVQAQTTQAFIGHLGAVEAALANDEPDLEAVTKALVALHPWWPYAGEVSGARDGVQTICERVDACVTEMFQSAVEAGEAPQADALLEWAGQYDVACAAFSGIAIADSSLRAKLKSGTSDSVSGTLDALDAELGKTVELQPAATVMAAQVLERLVPVWSTATEADDSLPERLAATLDTLEAKVEEAAGGEATAGAALGLLRFAARYDKLRAQLAPVDDGGLVQRLAPLAGASCLQAAEAEAAKTEGLNPQAVLNALEPFRTSPVKEAIEDEETRQRLVACLEALEERVRQAFCSAEEEGHSRRLEGLKAFAATFDAVCVDMEINEREGRRSLPEWLQLLAAVLAAEAEARRGQELSATAAADAMAEARALCAPAAEAEAEVEVVTRLRALPAVLRCPLLGQAAVAGAAGADEELRRCCREVEALTAALDGADAEEDGGELCRVLDAMQVIADRMDALDAELAKESGMNPNLVLEALEAVKASWEPIGDVYLLSKRLQTIFGVLETRMVDSCEKAIAAGATRKVSALLSFARRCDQVREAAAGDAQLRQRIAGLVAGARLDDAKAELEKEAGMNPMTVLSCLKTLAAIWPDLDEDSAELNERAQEIGTLLSGRMQTSMDEAAKAGNKRKADALVKFGKEYDEVLLSIGVQAGLCEELAKGLLRVAGGTGSDVGEDFMAQELRSLDNFMSAEAVKEAFCKWDKSGTGTILLEEFEGLIRSLDPRFTEEVVSALFAQADVNNDGQVEYEEFIGWLFG